MNTRTLTNQENLKTAVNYPETIAEEDVYYPPQIEDEMGETAIHFKLTALFFSLLENFFASREDALVAANMMVYFDEGNTQKWLAPDVFVCFGVENKLRKTFKVWEEGVFPQIVFEIASENTVENDLGKKYLDYSRLGVEEYYLLDPERTLLPSPLMAFQKGEERLIAVNVENDRVFSPRMNLEIVNTGNSFRLFNRETEEFLQAVLTGE